MVRSNAQVSDWRSAIDITKNGRVLDVIRLCPDFTFPSEWLAAFKEGRFVTFAKLYRNEIRYGPENLDSVVATPKGGTWKDWAESPRPSLIPEEEDRRCARYMLWTHYINFLRVNQLSDDIPRPMRNICARLPELREEFTDDELMRYQKEAWRVNIYHYLQSEQVDTIGRLEDLRPELEHIEGVLSAILEDDMGDFSMARGKPHSEQRIEQMLITLKTM